MDKIKIYSRKTKKFLYEKILGEKFLFFLYKKNKTSKFFLNLISKFPLFSYIYGFIHKLKISKYKIRPFIKKFEIDEKEFEKKVNKFKSFNDFFIRKLKPDAREINKNEDILTFPCDGKFLAFEKIDEINSFYIKGEKFNLLSFLKDEKLSNKYKDGSMLLCRLAPYDYHRFHFPTECIPQEAKLINGYLFSVNPSALMTNVHILCENKRMITTLKTKNFKDILFVEIGATNVGAIKQSYFLNKEYKKGEEKGYFELGGSSIALIFEKDTIILDEDLIKYTKQNIEIQSLMGNRFAKLKNNIKI
ncbi:MAG: Phosphatidylserine decarboxylase proenzyme [Candidatus Anoxychlamydiales bacterium]|nr:Phosphatidylserine decarboxylase proenzyme [Candidatus Anoxychlamydiales bacterium]